MLTLLAYLGLVDLQRRRCRRGHHNWGVWVQDTTLVPLYKYTMEDGSEQVGVEAFPLNGPIYRSCKSCPALQRQSC